MTLCCLKQLQRITRCHGKLVSDWVVPTGGCVDSSPLVVCYHGNSLAYVGSHSGLVLCVELMGGVIKWRRQPKRKGREFIVCVLLWRICNSR